MVEIPFLSVFYNTVFREFSPNCSTNRPHYFGLGPRNLWHKIVLDAENCRRMVRFSKSPKAIHQKGAYGGRFRWLFLPW